MGDPRQRPHLHQQPEPQQHAHPGRAARRRARRRMAARRHRQQRREPRGQQHVGEQLRRHQCRQRRGGVKRAPRGREQHHARGQAGARHEIEPFESHEAALEHVRQRHQQEAGDRQQIRQPCFVGPGRGHVEQRQHERHHRQGCHRHERRQHQVGAQRLPHDAADGPRIAPMPEARGVRRHGGAEPQVEQRQRAADQQQQRPEPEPLGTQAGERERRQRHPHCHRRQPSGGVVGGVATDANERRCGHGRHVNDPGGRRAAGRRRGGGRCRARATSSSAPARSACGGSAAPGGSW